MIENEPKNLFKVTAQIKDELDINLSKKTLKQFLIMRHGMFRKKLKIRYKTGMRKISIYSICQSIRLILIWLKIYGEKSNTNGSQQKIICLLKIWKKLFSILSSNMTMSSLSICQWTFLNELILSKHLYFKNFLTMQHKFLYCFQ